MSLIYLIRNQVNGKIYVGKTEGSLISRWKAHVKIARKGCNYAFYNAIRKYGFENFKPSILLDDVPENLSNANEINAIRILNSNDPRIGYNMTPGGDGAPKDNQYRLGHHNSKKTRMKISRSQRERQAGGISKETRRKMSISHVGHRGYWLGCHHYKETRRKISKSLMGHLVSVETRKKISRSLRKSVS